MNLLMQKGFPPKIVLLRIGNQSTRQIAEILIHHKSKLESLWHSDDYGILEIY